MVDTDDTTDDSRPQRTTPGVWHKLPTGEIKNCSELDLDQTMKNVEFNMPIFLENTSIRAFCLRMSFVN